MRTGWGTLACGIVLGAATGFVAGHLSAWTSAASTQPADHFAAAAPAPASDLTSLDTNDGPVFFPDHLLPPATASDLVHADAAVEAAGDHHPETTTREPATLPVPADAAPLSHEGRETLRVLLDAELADLTPADRDVWLDVLDGLPPVDAIGIVRLWKKFGSGPGLLADSHLADALPETRTPSILLPTPGPARSTEAPDIAAAPAPGLRTDVLLASQRTLLQQARQVFTRNLLSMETFGFRRSEPLFGNPALPAAATAQRTNADPVADGAPPTLQMIGARIDHRPGEILKSPNALDLAIEGEGFFVVTHPDFGDVFTRCGRFSRSPDGRLVLQTSCGELPVSPELVIPEDSLALSFSLDGELTVTRAGGAAEKIGALSLALFVAPAQLVQQDDALLAASERSGAPQIGRPNDGLRGGIVQNHLERSNVLVPLESAWLRQIDDWLELTEHSAPRP